MPAWSPFLAGGKPGDRRRTGPAEVRWAAPRRKCRRAMAASAYPLCRPPGPNITGFLEGVFDRYGSRLSHVGAGAGYRDLRREPALFTEAGLLIDGALFHRYAAGGDGQVRHGWTRIEGLSSPPAPAATSSRNSTGSRPELLSPPACWGAPAAMGGKTHLSDVVASFPLCIGKGTAAKTSCATPSVSTTPMSLAVLSTSAKTRSCTSPTVIGRPWSRRGRPRGRLRRSRRGGALFRFRLLFPRRFLADGFDAELDAVADAVARFADVAPRASWPSAKSPPTGGAASNSSTRPSSSG